MMALALVALLALLADVAHATFCPGDVLYQHAVASSCTSVGRDLIVSNTRTLGLDGELELTSIGGSLVVASNPALTSLAQLRVRHVGAVSIAYNYNLTDVDALAGANVTGGIQISANRILLNLEGLCNTSFVGGRIAVELPGVLYQSLLFCTASPIMADRAALVAALAVRCSDLKLSRFVQPQLIRAEPLTEFLVKQEWTSNNAAAEIKFGPIGEWDVSRVTDMESLFEDNVNAVADLNNWDVSAVTNMRVRAAPPHPRNACADRPFPSAVGT